MNKNIKKNWGLMNEEQRKLLKDTYGEERFNAVDTEMQKLQQNNTQQDVKAPENVFDTGGKQDNIMYQPQKQEIQPKSVETPKYDLNEQFDSSRFVQKDKDVKIQAGTGKETGLPDYQDASEARHKEIVNNLNAYWQDNPEFFQNRETFNQNFEYTQRNESQRALLDSFWKKKENHEKVSQYTTADQLLEGMNNAELTKEQMDLIKEKHPELYEGYTKKEEEKTNLRIVNKVVPSDPTDTVAFMQQLIKKANLNSVPYDLDKRFQENLEKYGVLKDSERLREQQDQMRKEYDERDRDEERIRRQYAGSHSAGYINAKLNQLDNSYSRRIAGMQQRYTAILQGRNQNLAIAQADSHALLQQTAEDQRVFNNKIKGFGFAMGVMNYETPEQQRQAELRMLESKQAINIQAQKELMKNKNISELEYKKDLLQLQESFTNPDINSSDPKQQKRALNQALSGYYNKYGDIIIRSQPQVVDDILKYAKDNNISVGEALTKNFIEPLQSKGQYKNTIQNKYALKFTSSGKAEITKTGGGELPENANKSQKINYIKDIVNSAGNSPQNIAQAIASIPDGTDMFQCGEFANHVGKAMGDNPGFGDELSQKITRVDPKKQAEIGDYVVMDTGAKLSSGIKAGHVGIVTGINDDGTITITDSNWKGNEKIMTHKLTQSQMRTVKGYRTPQPQIQDKLGAKIKLLEAGQLNKSDIPDLLEEANNAGRLEEFNKAQNKGMNLYMTETQIDQMNKVRKDFQSNPVVKSFEEGLTQFENLSFALSNKSGPGDMAAVFQFMKTLDPTSVVRESEYMAAAESAGKIEKWGNMYDRLSQGKVLTDTQAEQFRELAKEFIKNKGKSYERLYDNMTKDLVQFNIDKSLRPNKATDQLYEMVEGVKEVEQSIPTNNRDISNTQTTPNKESYIFNKYFN